MAINAFFPCNYRYPYTNDHELNLGWVLATIKAQESELSKFVALNTVKYADPFDWNITTQYATNTVVFNPADMTAYISVQPVPSGVQIDNTEYWTPIFTLADIFTAYKTSITPVEQIAAKPATQAISKGQLLWIDNVLYQADREIAQGTVVVPGENVLLTNISDELAAQVRTDNQLQTNITAEQTAREQADQLLQTNITAEQTAREQADAVLQNNINNVWKNVTFNSVVFIGDSFMSGGWLTENQRFAQLFAGMIGAKSFKVYAVGGIGFINAGDGSGPFSKIINDVINNDSTLDRAKVDCVIIEGGTNDGSPDVSTMQNVVLNTIDYARVSMPNAKIFIMSTPTFDTPLNNTVAGTFTACNIRGCGYINSRYWLIGNAQYEAASPDQNHPNENGMKMIAGYLYNIFTNQTPQTYCVLDVPVNVGTQEYGKMFISNNIATIILRGNIANNTSRYIDVASWPKHFYNHVPRFCGVADTDLGAFPVWLAQTGITIDTLSFSDKTFKYQLSVDIDLYTTFGTVS